MSVERKKLFLLTGKITVYFSLMAATFAVMLYIQFYKPTLVKELILSIDTFGVTSIGQEEISRQAAIRQLPKLTYEERQVLINRTVFLGATPNMVMLALGAPKERKAYHSPKGNGTIYIYYLPDDPRPTILRFEDEKLVHAYKGSALDLAKSP